MTSIFSDICHTLSGQPMFQILERAKELEASGQPIIHLEIGDPDFPSPLEACNAAKAAIDEGFTKYVQSSGIPDLKDACAKITYQSRKFLPSHDQILVTSGANIQIYLAVLALVNPGDEVIIPDPSFVSYEAIINSARGVARKVLLRESNLFRIDPSEVEKLISPRTKLIIINSPSNPTGSVLPPDIIIALYRLAEKYNLYILSDEVYGRMIYSDSPSGFYSPSLIDQCQDRTILVHSLSKTYSMTGWRIGAVTGPSNIIRFMSILYETITSCTPPFIQKAAIAAINSSNTYTSKMLSIYEERRNLFCSLLDEIPNIYCTKPEGAFYAFVNIKRLNLTSVDFSLNLLEQFGVASCPGSYFGDNGEGYIRFCFANSSDNIIKALSNLNEFVRILL
jgi:aspartate aminotransferase